jgi:hypothetical protein
LERAALVAFTNSAATFRVAIATFEVANGFLREFFRKMPVKPAQIAYFRPRNKKSPLARFVPRQRAKIENITSQLFK